MDVLENLVEQIPEDEDVVKKTLVLTTADLARQYVQNIENFNNECNMYFVSLNIPLKRKLGSKARYKEYGCCTQLLQYLYIRIKLFDIPLRAINSMLCYFEQTKQGNIHCHMLVNAHKELHRNDLRAQICSVFDFKKWIEASLNVHVEQVYDVKGVFEYLFNKDKKSYENIDQNIFKPLILL